MTSDEDWPKQAMHGSRQARAKQARNVMVVSVEKFLVGNGMAIRPQNLPKTDRNPVIGRQVSVDTGGSQTRAWGGDVLESAT